ncbi:hypothetical protein BN59_02998 [Legionella massiliensis]|uniref:Uncharacterized protein n=1 Tax=Legionella massiliensis TaxID=1034943 RepID=A0A078L0J9_9GAMM|nr:hypothetical protein [Legionella massiliensis]CDZ78686.1 hypothetical protein BN59_02998 [Legionella massiliensis]CEE14424.1 hypothetical protein BN1094_02998 [Legionella massiliensis]
MYIHLTGLYSLSIKAIRDKFNTLPKDLITLDLSGNNLGKMNILDLMGAFEYLPPNVSRIYLHNNFFSETDIHTNLATYFKLKGFKTTREMFLEKPLPASSSKSPLPVRQPAKRRDYHEQSRGHSLTKTTPPPLRLKLNEIIDTSLIRFNLTREYYQTVSEQLMSKGYRLEQTNKLLLQDDKAPHLNLLRMHDALMRLIGKDEIGHSDLIQMFGEPKRTEHLNSFMQNYQRLRQLGFSAFEISRIYTFDSAVESVKLILQELNTLQMGGHSYAVITQFACRKNGDLKLKEKIKNIGASLNYSAEDESSSKLPPNGPEQEAYPSSSPQPPVADEAEDNPAPVNPKIEPNPHSFFSEMADAEPAPLCSSDQEDGQWTSLFPKGKTLFAETEEDNGSYISMLSGSNC